MKLNGTHQILVYADDVNILGGSVHTIKEKAEALLVASKEIGLGVNADNIKYVHVMSRDQNAGRSQNMKTDNRSLERVEEFNYSVQNLLYSIFLSKILKIKICRTIILPVVLYWCETWSLTMREERRMRVFENRG